MTDSSLSMQIKGNMIIGKINRSLCFLLALCALFACDTDSGQQGQDSGGMLVPIGNEEISPLGDQLVVAYTSGAPWTVSVSDQSWLHVTPLRGNAGTTEITISADPNLDADRMCFLQFSSAGSPSIFTMTQERAILDIPVDSVRFGWQHGEMEFSVNSNVEWELTLDCENDGHFSVLYDGLSEGGATGDRNVKVTANYNNLSPLADEAIVRVRPVKRDNRGNVVDLPIDLTDELAVLQEFLVFLINDSRDDPDFEPFSELGANYIQGEGSGSDINGHIVSRSLTVTSEAEWEIDTDEFSGWGLSVETMSEENVEMYGRQAVRKTLQFTVANTNPSFEERSASAYLRIADDLSAVRTVAVRQAPYRLDTGSLSDVNFDNFSGSEVVSLNTSGPWSINQEMLPSWLEVSPAAGVGNAFITVSAQSQNLAFDDLLYVLTFNSGLNDLTAQLDVKQDRFLFEIDYPEALAAPLSRLDTNTYTMYVTSSGPWTLDLISDSPDDDSDWLDVSSSSGEKCVREAVTLRANAINPFKDKLREKRVVLKSTLHDAGDGSLPDGALQQLQFTQDVFRFDMILNGDTFDNVDFSSYCPEPNNSTFIMRCSAPWRVESSPEWLNIDLKEGTGETYPHITITADDNVHSDWSHSRRGIVTIVCDPMSDGAYTDSKSFYVNQDAFEFSIESEGIYNVAVLNETTYGVSVNCTSGAGWRMSQSPESSWTGISVGNYNGSRTFSFCPQQNGNLSSRTASVTISSLVSDDIPALSFTVSQDAYRFNTKSETFEFSELQAVTEKVALDCLGPWNVSSLPSWITVTPTSGSGNAQISVGPSSDNLGQERSGFFNVTSTVGGITHTKRVNVVQKDYVFDLISGFGDIAAEILTGASAQMKFRCSGSWTVVSTDNSIAQVSRGSGYGGRNNEETVNITVSPNYSLVQRNATVTLQSSDDGSKMSQVKISQPAYEFSVGTLSGFGYEKETQEVNFKCTGKATASSSASWVSVSVSSGKLVVTAEKNTTDKDRSAEITVESEHKSHNSSLSTVLTVSQAAEPKKKTGQ